MSLECLVPSECHPSTHGYHRLLPCGVFALARSPSGFSIGLGDSPRHRTTKVYLCLMAMMMAVAMVMVTVMVIVMVMRMDDEDG